MSYITICTLHDFLLVSCSEDSDLNSMVLWFSKLHNNIQELNWNPSANKPKILPLQITLLTNHFAFNPYDNTLTQALLESTSVIIGSEIELSKRKDRFSKLK